MKNFHPTSLTLGRQGSTYITDTAVYTGNFGVIQALSATVIAYLISATSENGDTVMQGTLTSVPVPAGVCIYGHWLSFQLTSGKVLAYNV